MAAVLVGAVSVLTAACSSGATNSAATTAASPATTTGASTTTSTSGLPGIRHVFLIVLENEGFDATFGTPSADPYLAGTLPAQGALLTNYYGIGHFSNDNYIALISGQAPNPLNQADCQVFANFPASATVATNGQISDSGCVFPTTMTTVADQLTQAHLTWKGYMEDMGNIPSRESAVCGHPTVGSPDLTEKAIPGDGYATRHDPFVYFHSIIDAPTPNFIFITPNLCNDGHDAPCVNQQGSPSALANIGTFLQTWVPLITGSPAFRKDGLLEITFDEADTADATSCCGETPGPASALPGVTGPGGGRIGTVLLSPFVKAGTASSVPYNHYSTLATIEDIFGLTRLGQAKTVSATFGTDVFSTPG